MLDYAVISEIGDRKVNEDCVGAKEHNGKYCFLVCDGLGGHGMGDIASRFVTDVFLEEFQTCELKNDFLSSTFSLAQERLINLQDVNKACNKMRTTVATVVVDHETASIGYIGDSRVYAFDNTGIKKRTIDHSVPQMLALAGEIEEKDIRTHPDRNKILRAMGTEWSTPMYELLPALNIAECRAFLLCSDGFWEYITEAEMMVLLNTATSAEDWLLKMVSVIKMSGQFEKMDNYSAIAVLNLDYH